MFKNKVSHSPGLLVFLIIILFLAFPLVIGAEEPCQDDSCGPAATHKADESAVPTIDYAAFKKLLDSGESFILLDARPKENYALGHIPGALSFPWSEANEETAKSLLPKGSKLIVYCSSASCSASSTVAGKLKLLGFDVLDYHGGVAEWLQKGNPLVAQQ